MPYTRGSSTMPDLIGQDAQFRCCVYLHVRTGTVILGVLHILLQLIVVSTLLMAALKHDVTNFKSSFDTVGTVNCQPRNPPTDIFYMLMHIVPGFTIFHQTHSDFTARFRAENLTHHEFFQAAHDVSKSSNLFDLLMGGTNGTSNEGKEESEVIKKEEAAPPPRREVVKIVSPKALTNPRCIDRRTNTYFSLCLALISLAFGYLLVHGVISRQPAHLLPFFCLQVFDFVVALICMLGYMSSASDISHWLRLKIATQEGVSASSIHLNSTSVSLILVSTSCLILAFKAYCIGMVWDCHRYLLITNRHGGLLPSSDLIPRFAALAPFLGRRRPLVLIHRRGRGSGSSSDGGLPDLTTFDGTARVFVDAVPTEPPKDSALPKYELMDSGASLTERLPKIFHIDLVLPVWLTTPLLAESDRGRRYYRCGQSTIYTGQPFYIKLETPSLTQKPSIYVVLVDVGLLGALIDYECLFDSVRNVRSTRASIFMQLQKWLWDSFSERAPTEALSIPANAFAPPPYFAARSTPEETRIKLWTTEEETKASGNNSPVAGNMAFKPDDGGKKDDSPPGPSIV